MLSERVDRPEHSFRLANLISKAVTDAVPHDPRWLPLAAGRQQGRDHFEAASLDQEILDAMIR